MFEIFQYQFMQNAIVASLLVSIICGVIGSLAVANRMVFLAGGIAHAAYGGIGLAYFLRLPYLIGTLGFALLAALVMALVSMNAKHRVDAVIGAIWAMGMALGIIFIDLTPGYTADLMSYLFGSLLAVPVTDIWVMSATAVIVIAFMWFFYSDILAFSYDEEFARIRGVAVARLYILIVCLLALTVVLTIRVVGLIMVIALLTIPPFIAEKYTSGLSAMMVMASLLGMLFTSSGLIAAFYLDLTAGACIILAAGTGYFVSILFDIVMSHLHRAHHAQPAKQG